MVGFLKNIIGDSNERELKRLQPIVTEVNQLEPEFEKLSNEQLRDLTSEFKKRLQEGEELDDILPEAFAASTWKPRIWRKGLAALYSANAFCGVEVMP